MKTTIKIFTIVIIMFALFFALSFVDIIEEITRARVSIIILSGCMIMTAFILKSDSYINFFSNLNESDFASKSEKSEFLNLFFANTLRIFSMVIIIETILIFVPIFSNSYMLDTVTIICAFINFVYMFYKLSMTFTK